MPWTYQWHIGYTDESGRWSVEHGYNGAFIDHDNFAADGSKTGRLDWINKFGLRFYVDHAAGKGLLHLWDGDKVKPHLGELREAVQREIGTIDRLIIRDFGFAPQTVTDQHPQDAQPFALG